MSQEDGEVHNTEGETEVSSHKVEEGAEPAQAAPSAEGTHEEEFEEGNGEGSDEDGSGSDDEYDDEEEYEDGEEDDEGQELSNKLDELRGMMSSFYPFGTQNQYSSVDLVLSKEEFELEDLLELDDFLPDLRRGKNNLLDYLVQTDVLEQLISYISTEPKQDEDETEMEKTKRFAHLAYEAIQTDVLKENMIADHHLMDKFFDFLDITTEMDPLRCAYFSRIVELLFERYPKELITYLRKKNCIVAKFVWHINNQYIVESLFRLIDSQISHQWLHDEDLIPLLMFKMAECEDAETQEKTANTFVEILDLFVPFPYSILTTQMFHSEIVAEQWDQFTLSKPTNYEKILNGLNVAIGILNLSYEGNMSDETPVFMMTVINRLEFFLELLKNPRDPARTFNMTYGSLTPPFGFLRVKILEFICALLNTRYQSVVDALWKTDIFTTLLDILFFYKWNNTLHYCVDQIIATIMTLDNGDMIISVLIEKCKLLDRFVDAFKNETDRTAGFMGHLVHLSNELIKAATYHQRLSTILDEHAGWKDLVNGKLKEINYLNNTPIGGGGSSGMGMNDDSQSPQSFMYQGHEAEETSSDDDNTLYPPIESGFESARPDDTSSDVPQAGSDTPVHSEGTASTDASGSEAVSGEVPQSGDVTADQPDQSASA
eukprot:TRINITY_DN1280_c0_g1_i1.p1 TRINITY_DN1280_c0_g1~~TRINITY_DN1280_c0_g1_i1.p1  ORF type:complete len:658 (+),score=139.75 TRINITY_DN1280_c0_g1_i1:273-2246(+)